MPSGIFVFVFALSLASVLMKGDSLRKFGHLMRQQDENTSISFAQQFDEEINEWAKGLEQLGLDIAKFVEKCRQPGSRCHKKHVLRQMGVLRRGLTELRDRLEELETEFVGQVSDQTKMDVSLRKSKNVLRQYDETFNYINEKIYNLVDQ
ncbi:uncharacterized protein LOC108098370 isoform X2 [Drosophila ficusphila]|uniref:uncharacterized protein LOC108098370 isoform X2 n=1 Tax=Drosophila ficusphila TaxID=30025 RepID=UPI0007E63BBC|nr:uncharacterized protein LOC108098370 isoform X2 [Drosophila ficusphila]